MMINRLLMAFAAACLFAMTAITFVDVVGRYFFNSPVNGAQEMISVLLGLGIFLALPTVTYKRAHITVDVLDALTPRHLQRPRRIVIDLLTILSLGALAYVLFKQGVSLGQMYMATPHLGIPLSPILFCLCGVCIASLIVFIPHVLRTALRSDVSSKTDAEQPKGRLE
jgi:TRAP-type C4-dicarboxylate transport system permease small subunit